MSPSAPTRVRPPRRLSPGSEQDPALARGRGRVRRSRVRGPGGLRPRGSDRLNRRGSLEPDGGRPRRSVVVALVLACLSLVTLDHVHGPDGGTPVDPLRNAAGEVYGPVQAGADALLRPVLATPRWLRTRHSLDGRINDLQAQNDALRARLATSSYDHNRLQEYDDLSSVAARIGYALVPAHVVAVGPAQSFAETVTIDAGSRAGLRPDLTVVNGSGLVGRVIRVTSTTATVLLAIDPDSTVGGRVGSSMKVGFLHGDGGLGGRSRLDLDLVDQTFVPAQGQSVVTWGSPGGSPYVAGVPVGTVEQVYSSPRETTQRAVIDPYVDFSALDSVGVVLPSGATGDRGIIQADGIWRRGSR